ncbi:MAG: hypothetical protein RR496_07990, partial [Lachnospiraceae bacterium]
SNASELSKILKVLLLRKLNADVINKKFADTDNRLLLSLQHLLFNELAIVLKAERETIEEQVLANLSGMQLAVHC